MHDVFIYAVAALKYDKRLVVRHNANWLLLLLEVIAFLNTSKPHGWPLLNYPVCGTVNGSSFA